MGGRRVRVELPYWFDEDVVAAKLYAKIELSQEDTNPVLGDMEVGISFIIR